MIGELGRVGNMATVALLHAYVPDPELGPLAVEAIRTIERRLAQHLTGLDTQHDRIAIAHVTAS
jgi:hypothetical protein